MIRIGKLKLVFGLAALCVALLGIAVTMTQPALSKDDRTRTATGQGLTVSTLGF